jgi:hypothetical protein
MFSLCTFVLILVHVSLSESILTFELYMMFAELSLVNQIR